MQIILLRRTKVGDKICKKGDVFTICGLNWGGEDKKFYYYVNYSDKIDVANVKVVR